MAYHDRLQASPISLSFIRLSTFRGSIVRSYEPGRVSTVACQVCWRRSGCSILQGILQSEILIREMGLNPTSHILVSLQNLSAACGGRCSPHGQTQNLLLLNGRCTGMASARHPAKYSQNNSSVGSMWKSKTKITTNRLPARTSQKDALPWLMRNDSPP